MSFKSRLFALASCLVAACALSVAQSDAAVQWVTLGTSGGPIIHASQSQIANALVVGDAVYIFDAGDGVVRQLDAAKLPLANVRAIFISHNHPDHNEGLDPLLLGIWREKMTGGGPVPVLGPPGTTTLIKGLISANAPTVAISYNESGLRKPPLDSVFKASDFPHEMNQPTLTYEDPNIRVTAISVNHFLTSPGASAADIPRAVAFRAEGRGRSYVFSGDTGPSMNLRMLAKDADVLVTEVVDLRAIEASLRRIMKNAPPGTVDAQVARMSKVHLTGEAIGEIAAAAGVKRVVLTHFVPAFEDQPQLANFTRGIAPTYKGPVVLAHELDRF